MTTTDPRGAGRQPTENDMTPKTAEPKRTHRPIDVRVAELEQRIAEIRAREARKQAKAQPEGKALLFAVKAIDKALPVAVDARNESLLRALEAARAPLSEQMIQMGMRLPDRKAGRKGRKGAAA